MTLYELRHSLLAVWPIVHELSGGYNKTGIALACIAILNYASRPSSTPLASPAPEKQSPNKATASGSWLAASISLGSLLFTLHCLLEDSSTLIAWSWTGYPINGPVPHLHGSLTHVAHDGRGRRAAGDGHDLSQPPFSPDASFHLDIHLSDPVSDHIDNVDGGLWIFLRIWALEPEE